MYNGGRDRSSAISSSCAVRTVVVVVEPSRVVRTFMASFISFERVCATMAYMLSEEHRLRATGKHATEQRENAAVKWTKMCNATSTSEKYTLHTFMWDDKRRTVDIGNTAHLSFPCAGGTATAEGRQRRKRALSFTQQAVKDENEETDARWGRKVYAPEIHHHNNFFISTTQKSYETV